MLSLTPTTACYKTLNPAFPVRSFSASQPTQRFGSGVTSEAYTTLLESKAATLSPWSLLMGRVAPSTSSNSVSSPLAGLMAGVSSLLGVSKGLSQAPQPMVAKTLSLLA
jgi:hypothetical protein